MKKLLVATSALVAAAGSAAALDVTLGGEISINAALDVDNSGFNGADWGAGFTLTASGESMGWTYGGTLEFGMFEASTPAGTNPMAVEISSASAYMGGDFMGRIAFQDSCGNFVEPAKVTEQVGSVAGDHCINWTGFEVAGVELMAGIGLESAGGLIIGASTDVGGASVDAEYDVDSGNIDAIIGLSAGGYDVTLNAAYDAEDPMGGDAFYYSVGVGADLGDLGVNLEYSPTAGATGGKDIMAELTYGDCLTFDIGIDPLSTGDGVYMWSAGYDCDLHDGFGVEATIGQASAGAGLTGNVGATVSF